MTHAAVPDPGVTLLTGPSNVGKTKRTASALRAWIDEHGSDGVVVLDFAPEVERDGTLLGGRLDRFGPLPEDIWVGVLDAHAPRADSDSETAATELAADNATRARELIDEAPPPRAAFVNDATIPFQHESGDIDAFCSYLETAEIVVMNAFESDELGRDDPVSQCERAALERFKTVADRHDVLTRDE